MLIRWATKNDMTVIEKLVRELDNNIIQMIEQYEVVISVDRMSGNCNGVISFSRLENNITFFVVSSKDAADSLLKVALRQLDTNKNIAVNLSNSFEKSYFVENGFSYAMGKLCRKADNNKRGGSFHYNYPKFIEEAQQEFCPVCNDTSEPDDINDVIVNDNVWVCGQYPGQGRLFGKLYVMPRKHYFQFEEIPEEEMKVFMKEVQYVGKAVLKVTGAEKINYEMHSNSGAHLHIHLFPRYLDDDFPSTPIDYRICEPAPYESYDEYLWFVEQMKKELRR